VSLQKGKMINWKIAECGASWLSKHGARVLTVVSALLFLVGSPCSAGEPCLRVDGLVKMTTPDVTSRAFCSFSGLFNGGRYQITLTFTNGETLVSGTDGTSSFTLNTMAPARTKDPETWQFGYVTPGVFPERTFTPAQMLWFAFAPTNAVVHAVLQKRPEFLEQYSAKELKTTLRFEDAEGCALPRIAWYAPNYLIDGTNHIPLLEYKDGYKAGSFQILATTNIQGARRPLVLQLECFAPKASRLGAFVKRDRVDVRATTLLTATVTDFQTTASPATFLPASTGRLTISDWRFAPEIGGEVNYVVTNRLPSVRQWLPATDPFFRELLLRCHPSPPPRTPEFKSI
jgi:hypothetical protein